LENSLPRYALEFLKITLDALVEVKKRRKGWQKYYQNAFFKTLPAWRRPIMYTPPSLLSSSLPDSSLSSALLGPL
jgi:hypothetical protein